MMKNASYYFITFLFILFVSELLAQSTYYIKYGQRYDRNNIDFMTSRNNYQLNRQKVREQINNLFSYLKSDIIHPYLGFINSNRDSSENNSFALVSTQGTINQIKEDKIRILVTGGSVAHSLISGGSCFSWRTHNAS